MQRLEPHRTRIHHQQTSDQAFAESDDLADDLQRRHRAEHAGQRAENAGFLQVATVPSGGGSGNRQR